MLKYATLIIALLAVACNQKKEATQAPADVETTAPDAPAVSFSIQSITKTSASCATDSNACATVDISVPQARGIAAADPINARITGALVEAIDIGDVRSTGLGEAIDTYIASYDSFLVEVASDGLDFINSWSFEVEGEVLYQDSQYVCISLPFYTYMGGAHPNMFTRLLTFSSTTGEEIDVLSLVADTMLLKTRAEEAFRIARKFESDVSLDEEGFFWGKEFSFPENIGIVKEGLYFMYNPYEAAPYAAGPTEFVIKAEMK